MAERMVQVPESLPLYKIRDAVDTACQKHAWNILLSLTDMEFSTVVEDVTEAVANLLSQPTPAAGPPLIDHAVDDVVIATVPDPYPVGRYGGPSVQSGILPHAQPAEPLRIEDMAPGTRFAGKFIPGGELRYFERATGTYPVRSLPSRTGYRIDDIAPSTIRDVREPSEERDE